MGNVFNMTGGAYYPKTEGREFGQELVINIVKAPKVMSSRWDTPELSDGESGNRIITFDKDVKMSVLEKDRFNYINNSVPNQLILNPKFTGQNTIHLISEDESYRTLPKEISFWGFNTPKEQIDRNLLNQAYDLKLATIITTDPTIVEYGRFDDLSIKSLTVSNSLEEATCYIGTYDDISTQFIMFGFDNSGLKAPTDCRGLFQNCTSLTELDLSYFDTSKVIITSDMFSSCSSLTTLDISHFDTSKVINMDYMFDGCSSLTTLDLSSFDTSKVASMAAMFGGCSSLTTLDLSSFDTSTLTHMESMFDGCSSLTTLDLSSFDTSKVSKRYAFRGCVNLKTVYCRNQEEIDRYKATNPPANINFVIKGGAN